MNGSDAAVTHLQSVVYKVLPTGSQRGKPLLVADDGFTYTVRRSSQNSTVWRCSNRKCGGIVKETQNAFDLTAGHNHSSKPGLHLGTEIRVKVSFQLISCSFDFHICFIHDTTDI